MDCAAACIKGDNIAAHFHIMAHSFKVDIIGQIFGQSLQLAAFLGEMPGTLR